MDVIKSNDPTAASATVNVMISPVVSIAPDITRRFSGVNVAFTKLAMNSTPSI